MRREKNYKTARLIEALEYIDVRFIEEAAEKIKVRPTGQMYHGTHNRKNALRQILALAACILLLSAAIPAITYITNHLPDIVAFFTGDGTTDTAPELTHPETPAPETTADMHHETTAPLYDGTTAEPDVEYDGSRGLLYKMWEDGKSYYLAGMGICTDENIVVASTYGGYPVTVIGEDALAGYDRVKSITIPDSVTAIDMRAFKDCTGLESITIPDTVSYISGDAFMNCTSLKSIKLPASLELVNPSVFANCTALEEIVIPDFVTEIYIMAFYQCTNLKSVTLGRRVEKLWADVFRDCTKLTEISFAGTISRWNAIEKDDEWNFGSAIAVVHCTDGDVKIAPYVEPEPEYDGSQGLEYKVNEDGKTASLVGIGTCTDKDIVVASTYNGLPVTSVDYSFSKISNVTSITVSDSVLTIGGIDNMPDLVSVYFSKSVEGINPESLIGCPNLVIIEVDKDNPKYMSSGNCLIEKATKTIVHGCKGSVIPTDGSVTVIGEFSFHGCDWLTELTVPKNIERIDSYAFAGCDNLKKVILPDSLTYLGFGAFAFCESLESVTFGKNLETIGGSVFEDCPKLRELHFPRTLKFLGSLALDRCYSLSKVSFAGTVREWNAIEKTWMWYGGERLFTVIHCSDGEVFAEPMSYDEATELARQYWAPIESGYFVCYASYEMYLLVRPDEVIEDRIYIDRYTGEISMPKLTYPDIPASLLKVLLNETTYIRQFDSESEGYFKDTVLDYPTAETGSFGYAVCDLDGDGKEELILSSLQYEIVLREFEGKVYGYLFDFRSLLDLKTDGSFNFVSNAGMTSGTARLSFDGIKYVYNELTRTEKADDGSISYFIDDKKVTKEEFDAREALLSQEEATYEHLAIYPLRAWYPGG